MPYWEEDRHYSKCKYIGDVATIRQRFTQAINNGFTDSDQMFIYLCTGSPTGTPTNHTVQQLYKYYDGYRSVGNTTKHINPENGSLQIGNSSYNGLYFTTTDIAWGEDISGDYANDVYISDTWNNISNAFKNSYVNNGNLCYKIGNFTWFVNGTPYSWWVIFSAPVSYEESSAIIPENPDLTWQGDTTWTYVAHGLSNTNSDADDYTNVVDHNLLESA